MYFFVLSNSIWRAVFSIIQRKSELFLGMHFRHNVEPFLRVGQTLIQPIKPSVCLSFIHLCLLQFPLHMCLLFPWCGFPRLRILLKSEWLVRGLSVVWGFIVIWIVNVLDLVRTALRVVTVGPRGLLRGWGLVTLRLEAWLAGCGAWGYRVVVGRPGCYVRALSECLLRWI